MTEYPASCKFCRIPVLLRVHQDALGMFDIAKWVSLAACNRCADYHSNRLSVVAAIQKWANQSFASRSKPEEDRHEALAKCTESLEKLTRRLASDASSHYRCGFTWEPDWVQQILSQPDKATMTCQFYERQLWRDWNRRRNHTEAVQGLKEAVK